MIVKYISKIGNIFTDQYKMVGKNKSGGEDEEHSVHRANEANVQVEIGNEQPEERSELVQPIEVDGTHEVKSKMSSKENKNSFLWSRNKKNQVRASS